MPPRPVVALALPVALVAASALVAPPTAGAAEQQVTTVLENVDRRPVGEVTFRESGDGTWVDVQVGGLPPGFHAFHVHGVGICDPAAPQGPFTSAGGHHVGQGTTHGDHDGDLPSLYVRADGQARASFLTDRFDLAELRDADGSALVIHAGRDNYANIPERYVPGGSSRGGPDSTTLAAGDAGGRIACAVVPTVTELRDVLQPGQLLRQGDVLRSPGSRYVLVLQHDGNLVVYQDGGGPRWASGTRDMAVLVMQEDGNVVGYRRDARPVWARFGRPGSVLAMQDDGNLVLYTGDGRPVWASDPERPRP